MVAAVVFTWLIGINLFAAFWTNVVFFALFLFDKVPAYNTDLLVWLGVSAVAYFIAWVVVIVTGLTD